MTTRVFLVSPALSRARREARFSGGADDLDATGTRQAREARQDAGDSLPDAGRVFVSPSARCRGTAGLLGLTGEAVPALAPCAMGRWQGRTLDEVAAAEPESVAAWLSDPAAAPHGGESLTALHARVARWLDALAGPVAPGRAGATGPVDGSVGRPGAVVAVVEPDVIRAAVVHALGAGHRAFWRIDVRPLSVTELGGRDGRWNLLSGRPLRTGPR